MKIISIILLLNLLCLSHLQLIFDITPFEEVKIDTSISISSSGYFKINLKDVKGSDKNNLYIQFRISRRIAGQYFTVNACGFSEEPSVNDLNTFKDGVNDIKGTSNSDSIYNYYIYKFPKFENDNWVAIRIDVTNYSLTLSSVYVDSEKEENINLAWNIVITVISAMNLLLLVFILLKIFTLKKQLSAESIGNKLTTI